MVPGAELWTLPVAWVVRQATDLQEINRQLLRHLLRQLLQPKALWCLPNPPPCRVNLQLALRPAPTRGARHQISGVEHQDRLILAPGRRDHRQVQADGHQQSKSPPHG